MPGYMRGPTILGSLPNGLDTSMGARLRNGEETTNNKDGSEE